jgi:hypothetical protein
VKEEKSRIGRKMDEEECSIKEVTISIRLTKGFNLLPISQSDCSMFLFSVNTILILLNPVETHILIDEDSSKELLLMMELNSSNKAILSSKIFPRLELIESEKCLNKSILFVANVLKRRSKFVEMEEIK